MISLKPQYLKRYKDIGRLLLKYGRSDLVQQSGLADRVGPLEHNHHSNGNGKLQPECLADDLEHLGPAYIKLGQLLSTRPDFIPQPYLDALARLQDHAEPIPVCEVKRIIAEELHADASKLFLCFDDQPLATASLGQVHRARLPDGRQVVIKIQRPNIAQSLGVDLKAFEELAAFLEHNTTFGREYQLVRLVDNLHQSVTQELDYRREASNAELLRENLTSFQQIVVPRPITELTTARVLTMEYVHGAKITDLTPAQLTDVDCEGLADELFRAYLYQVLVVGAFHADPHPGNLALTDDRRIVLMDFGIVVRVTPQMKSSLVKLLLAVAEGRGEQAAATAEEMGQQRHDFQAGAFRRQIVRVVADNQDAPVSQLSAGRVILHIQHAAGANGLILPDAVVMLGKTLMNLDLVVATLDPSFNPNQALRDHATEIMQAHSKQRLNLSTIYHSLLETAEFAQELPARANKISRMLAENDLRLHIDAIDETKLIRGFHKVANRITAGLVISALIVGASVIMHLDSSVTVFGYPALAFIFFIISAIAGFILIWKAMFSDSRDEHFD